MKIIIFIIAAILVYAVLSPQMKEKVNDKATNSIKEIGTMAIDKITGKNSTTATSGAYELPSQGAIPTDYGKPSCKSNTDCVQFGSNITCNLTTGHCVGG